MASPPLFLCHFTGGNRANACRALRLGYSGTTSVGPNPWASSPHLGSWERWHSVSGRLFMEEICSITKHWRRDERSRRPPPPALELSVVLKLQATVFRDREASCLQICTLSLQMGTLACIPCTQLSPRPAGVHPPGTHARARTAGIPTGTSRDPPATPLGTRLPLIRRHTPPRTLFSIVSQARPERRGRGKHSGHGPTPATIAARSSQLRPRP